MPVVFLVLLVRGLLDLPRILSIDLVDIALLVAILGSVFAAATVARVILIVVRALIVVPVIVVVRNLLAVVAVILGVTLIDATISLRRTAVGGRPVVLLPTWPFVTGLLATVLRAFLPLAVVFLVVFV